MNIKTAKIIGAYYMQLHICESLTMYSKYNYGGLSNKKKRNG